MRYTLKKLSVPQKAKKSAADTEAIQLLQAQPEDDSKKASESQEIHESTLMDIGQKKTETKEGIIIIILHLRILFTAMQ